MVRKVIDFEAAKDRQVRQEIDADQAQGELRARLITVMVLSGLSDTSLTSVALNALLTMLQSKGDSPDEAKQRIASALAAFPWGESPSLSGRFIYLLSCGLPVSALWPRRGQAPL
jgi:hypothetical protein